VRISIIVHPNSREEKVEEQEDGSYVVRVKAPAEGGRANVAVVKLLSKYFNAEARIVSGFTSRHKVVEVA
jgi:hypothetical protein